MLLEQGLDLAPGLAIYDRVVKAVMHPILVGQPPDIDRVRQDLVEMPPADEPAPGGLASPIGSSRQPGVLLIKDGLEPHDAAGLEIALEEIANQFGMLFDHVERPVLDPIAERNHAAHPNALLLRGSDLVTYPLARDLALELGERQEDVQGQSSHAGRRVER